MEPASWRKPCRARHTQGRFDGWDPPSPSLRRDRLMGLMAAAQTITHSTRFMLAQGRPFTFHPHPYPIGFVSTRGSSRCNSLILWIAACTSASVNSALMATLAW